MTTPLRGSQVSLFQPNQISGCRLWFDAADPTTVVLSGANVTQWNDKSGNGFNAAAEAGNTTYSSNGIVFTGAQRLQTSLAAANNTQTMFSVMSFSSANYMDILGVKGTGNTGYQYILNAGTQTLTRFAGPSIATGVTLSQNVRSIYGATVNGGSASFLYSNGTQTGTNSSTPTVSGSGTVAIGGYTDTGTSVFEAFIGTINEILLYGVVLSTTQRQQVEGYLAWKWGLQGSLPSTHPYRNTPLYTIPPFPLVPRVAGLTNGAVFNPTQISGCQLWLDAADTSTITLSGGNLSAITDKSGTNKTLTVTNTVGYINRTAIVFTDSVGRLAVASMPSAPFDYIMVCTANSSSAGFRTMLRSANIPGTHQFLIQAGTNNVGMYDGTNVSLFGSITQSPNEMALFYGAMATNRTIQASKNGTVSLTAPSNAGNESVIAWIGSSSGGGQPFGQLQELLVYSGTLSFTQRQQLEGYLAWKWGLVNNLPNGHPFKTPPIAPFAYSIRRGGQNVWQPTQLSGCQLWLDAADTSVFNLSGSNVLQWNDKSGNSRNAVPRDNTKLPTRYLGFNQRFTVESSSDQSFGTPLLVNIASSNVQGPSGMSFFMAFKFISGTVLTQYESPRIISFEGSNRFDYGEINTAYTPGGYTNTVNSIVNLNINVAANNLEFRFQGSSLLSTTPSLVTSQFTTSIGIFGRGGASTNIPAQAQISEYIIYNQTLSLSQRQQVEGYLAWKWGLVGSLPANHPFKRWPPAP